MRELEMIKYLLQELEEELKKKELYEKEIKLAKTKINKEYKYDSWRFHMSDSVKRPKKSVITGNTKKIRSLCLKINEIAMKSLSEFY